MHSQNRVSESKSPRQTIRQDLTPSTSSARVLSTLTDSVSSSLTAKKLPQIIPQHITDILEHKNVSYRQTTIDKEILAQLHKILTLLSWRNKESFSQARAAIFVFYESLSKILSPADDAFDAREKRIRFFNHYKQFLATTLTPILNKYDRACPITHPAAPSPEETLNGALLRIINDYIAGSTLIKIFHQSGLYSRQNVNLLEHNNVANYPHVERLLQRLAIHGLVNQKVIDKFFNMPGDASAVENTLSHAARKHIEITHKQIELLIDNSHLALNFCTSFSKLADAEARDKVGEFFQNLSRRPSISEVKAQDENEPKIRFRP